MLPLSRTITILNPLCCLCLCFLCSGVGGASPSGLAAKASLEGMEWVRMSHLFEQPELGTDGILVGGRAWVYSDCRAIGESGEVGLAVAPEEIVEVSGLDAGDARYYGLSRIVVPLGHVPADIDPSVFADPLWLAAFLAEGEKLEPGEDGSFRVDPGGVFKPRFEAEYLYAPGSTDHSEEVEDFVRYFVAQDSGLGRCLGSTLLLQHRFSKVLGMRNAVVALSASNYLVAEDGTLVMSVYSFHLLYALPPGFMGGYAWIEKQARNRVSRVWAHVSSDGFTWKRESRPCVFFH